MSAWKAERWEDTLYVSHPVWWQVRFDDNLPAEGIIWGFPQDVCGVIVQFDHVLNKHARYFVTFEELEKTYNPRARMSCIQSAKLVEVIEKREYYRKDMEVRPWGIVVLQRKRIPLWTSYR